MVMIRFSSNGLDEDLEDSITGLLNTAAFAAQQFPDAVTVDTLALAQTLSNALNGNDGDDSPVSWITLPEPSEVPAELAYYGLRTTYEAGMQLAMEQLLVEGADNKIDVSSLAADMETYYQERLADDSNLE